MTDMNEKRCANCFWHISGGKSGGGACMNDWSDYYCKRTDDDFSCKQWEKKEEAT